jgi:hypothetical protein
MPFCSECGTKIQDDAKFCESCGAPTETAGNDLDSINERLEWAKKEFDKIKKEADVEPSELAAPSLINWDEIKDKIPFLKDRTYIVLAVVLLIAAITNPSEEKHQRVAAAFASNAMKKNSASVFADGFTSVIATGIVKLTITSQSYVFFSLTKVINSEKIIGVGAFGYVYLFPNLTFGGNDDDKWQTKSTSVRQLDLSSFDAIANQSSAPVALERAGRQQVLSAEQLDELCEDNKVMYDRNYVGKIFTLYGTIKSVDEDDDGDYVVKLNVMVETQWMRCADCGSIEVVYGEKAFNKISTFSKGETFREEVVGTKTCNYVLAAISIDEFNSRQ